MARPSRQLGKAQSFQFASDGGFVDGYPEFLKQPLNEVLAPPTHHTVDSGDRTAFNDLAWPVENAGGGPWPT